MYSEKDAITAVETCNELVTRLGVEDLDYKKSRAALIDDPGSYKPDDTIVIIMQLARDAVMRRLNSERR